MKKICILLGIFLLYGCGNSESEVCRYYIQNDLDNKNFDSALSRLENTTCQASYEKSDYFVDVGTAYLGRAGFTLPNILAALIVDDTIKETESFQSFINSLSTYTNDYTEVDLSNAYSNFKQYLNEKECVQVIALNSTEKSVCLTIGFIEFVRSMIALKAMTGQELDDWISDKEAKLPAASCALKYSVEHAGEPLPFQDCHENAMVEFSEPVTFTTALNTTRNYNLLSVLHNNQTHYFLEDEMLGSTVFTDQYCQTDYAACTDVSDSACYPCPLLIDDKGTPIDVYLVDALNEAIETLSALALEMSPNDNAEIKEAIDEFIYEIKPEGCGAIAEGEPCLSLDDILDYLNK